MNSLETECNQCKDYKNRLRNLEEQVRQCDRCSVCQGQTKDKETKAEAVQVKDLETRSCTGMNEEEQATQAKDEAKPENVLSSSVVDADIKKSIKQSNMNDCKPNQEDYLVPRGCNKNVTCPVEAAEPRVSSERRTSTKLNETVPSLQEKFVVIDAKDSNFDHVPEGIAVLPSAKSTDSKPEPWSSHGVTDPLWKSSLENTQLPENIEIHRQDLTSTLDKSQVVQNDVTKEHDKVEKEKESNKKDSKPVSPKLKRRYSNDKHGSKDKISLNNLLSKDINGISAKHKPLSECTANRYSVDPPSSDLQSHPITQPTDHRYPGLVTTGDNSDKEFQASVITDIVNKLQHFYKHCQLLTEAKAILENDMIKLEKQYHTTIQEMTRNMKLLKEENEALRLNQREQPKHEADPRLLQSFQSTISEAHDYVHIEKTHRDSSKSAKEMEDSLLASLKQMDEKDRLIEKYKTHMQKLAAANQSWYEQQAETAEKMSKMQTQAGAMREQIKSLTQQAQNLEREIQHEKEQRAAFEKMYKSARDRLDQEIQPYRERAEKAERETTMYKEQLVNLMDEKDQLHIENRKLQTEAWVKQQAGISPGNGSSTEEQLRTQIDVLKHQAATWKDDFERERKDRARAQAETDRQKKKNDGIHIELQNAEYRIEGLTRDLQNLRARNIELERKLREKHSPSPPPLYMAQQEATPTANHSGHEFELLDYPSGHPDRWNCRKCTYSNIPERSTCELCGASRESRRTNQGHYTAPQKPSDITFPHYRLSRDVVPDQNYLRH